jgi:RNA-directed DNA polymerase
VSMQFLNIECASASSAFPVTWHEIDWARVYRNVRKQQVRIVKAVTQKDWRKVKTLQRFLTRLFSARAMAVRRVTENTGKRTAGVDGALWCTPETKMKAVLSLNRRGYKPLPLRRIHIPKANGKMRPLSIPTMRDRAMQALYLLALDPVSETLADRNSYGFRRERSCADAIEQCFTALAQKNSAQWVLEGDIKGCFDNISHDWLLTNIPMDKYILRKWLKAGFVKSGQLFPTTEGTPQGGIISPVLANMTLDCLESVLEARFGKHRSKMAFQNKVNLVRYADDFIITGASKEILVEEALPLVENFLADRGLSLSVEKTKVIHIDEGFDFLGQNVRKYQGKLIIKPSRNNIKKFLGSVRNIVKDNKAAKQSSLIRLLNPMITGWANYHRHVCSKEVFNRMDHIIAFWVWQWAIRRHPNKSASWLKKRYFSSRGTRNWVFSASIRDKNGEPMEIALIEAADVPIKRHVKIRGDANPYDPAQEVYFEERISRKMLNSLSGKKRILSLWKRQGGLCPLCSRLITWDSGWHSHHVVRRADGGSDKLDNLVLLHPFCHVQLHSRLGDETQPVLYEDLAEA